jgi:hypothetical protein
LQVVNKLSMLALAVNNMLKPKTFYADTLGLKVATVYCQHDSHSWVSLVLVESGVTITLTTYHENVKSGSITLWIATSDTAAAHKEFGSKGVNVSKIGDDLHCPGSGIRWFNFKEPDGNLAIVNRFKCMNTVQSMSQNEDRELSRVRCDEQR